MTFTSKKLQILICGSGNGGHCMSAVAGVQHNLDVRILSLTRAKQFADALKESMMKLTIHKEDGSQSEVFSKPNVITDNPVEAMYNVDIVFIVVPALAHEKYLKSIMPYVQPNMIIVGLPGQAGFEFQVKDIFGDKAKHCCIISFESTPWVCRVEEFGKHVHIVGLKEQLAMSFLNTATLNTNGVLFTMQNIFGQKPRIYVMNNPLGLTLMTKSILHPPLMFGKWFNWDGKPLESKPLFYQDVSEKQIRILCNVSNEVIRIGKALEKKDKNVDMSDVLNIYDWLKSCFGPLIANKSSLLMAMKTNRAWEGLSHPMIMTNKGYVPDFLHRYVTEDVPFGMVVLKGIAEIANVATPTIDEIILWTQQKLDKEFIVGSKLSGKDVSSTRSPQRYGLKTVGELLNYVK